MAWWSPRFRKRLVSFYVHGMMLTMRRARAHTTRAETQAVSGRLRHADCCLDVIDAALATDGILETLDTVASRNSHVADRKEVTGTRPSKRRSLKMSLPRSHRVKHQSVFQATKRGSRGEASFCRCGELVCRNHRVFTSVCLLSCPHRRALCGLQDRQLHAHLLRSSARRVHQGASVSPDLKQ